MLVSLNCPTCGTSLPPAIRPEYCPVCTLQGALAPESVPPPVLHQVGDYELVEELARGGAGVVFRARQTSLGRQVAVKLLLAGQFANTATRQRFTTEATAAASLRHPHIVTIHEVGEHEGQPWLAMELMEGGTLDERVRPGPMPPHEAAAMVAKLAQAVQAAHDAGILHRDLKPSN
ncbi:MAG TPA: serine/threonine protein kinase, partial [Verrucomicrobiales bacterium]|nr:serine/threonine protein kinase [Verrucomicrobiales bacterium]